MKVFYIYNIQRSVKQDNTIIIQGHCNEHYMRDAKIEALIRVDGEWKNLPVTYSVRKIGTALTMMDRGRTYSYFASFFVDMGEYANTDRGTLKITFYNPDVTGDEKTITLYECRLFAIQEKLSQILYNIDDVDVQENVVRISGWAAGADKIRVYKVEDRHPVPIKSEIRRVSRFDATDVLCEYDGKEAIGFHINVVTDEDFLLLRFRNKDNTNTVVELRLKEYKNKRSPVNVAMKYARKVSTNVKTIGVIGTAQKVVSKVLPKFGARDVSYDKWREVMAPTEKELERQRSDESVRGPKFSILVPLYKTPEPMLRALVESIKAQTYKNFEVIFSDGSPSDSRIKELVEKACGNDERFIYVDGSESAELSDDIINAGICVERKDDGSLGIADNTNQALMRAVGDYIVLGDHDDLFTPDALYECAKKIRDASAIGSDDAENAEKTDDNADNANQNLVIYSDEDKVDEAGKHFFDPHFKPDYNIDLLRSVNYICHMFTASRDLAIAVGGFRSEFDGAQDYDFILRCTEKADKIYHIPKVLYHWRSSDASTATNPEAKMYAFEAGKKAIEEHYKRVGLEAEVEYGDNLGYYNTRYKIQGEPLISIIIPNKDHIDDLKKCIESVDARSTYRNIEYIIVENNSTEDETFKYYEELSKRDDIKVVFWDGIFNYSEINNFGVKEAKGEYLLLLNNDTEMIAPEAIESMLGFCQREDVGAVGARLYYNDDTLQHAGTIVGIGGIAGHAFIAQTEEPGSVYFNRSKMAADFSAVTAACLMTKTEVYNEVGGLDASFKVAFNDIDFCLRIVETGRLIVYDPMARFYHYESKSRGYEDSPEKKERFWGEIQKFRARWQSFLDKGDPCYNPNLTLDKQDFSLKQI